MGKSIRDIFDDKVSEYEGSQNDTEREFWSAYDRQNLSGDPAKDIANINSFLSSIGDYGAKIERDQTNRGYTRSGEFNRYKKDERGNISDLYSQVESYKGIVDRNKDYFKDYNIDASSFDNVTRYLGYLSDSLDQEQEFWNQFGNEKQYNTYMKFNGKDYSNNDDFKEGSAYVSTAKEGYEDLEPFMDYATGKLVWTDSGFEDPIYDYINGNEYARNRIDSNSFAATEGSLGNRLSKEYLKYMNTKEVSTYNYLYSKNKNEANEYLDYLKNSLESRQKQAEQKDVYQFAQENPGAAFVAARFANLLTPFQLLNQAADLITEGRVNNNAEYNRYLWAGSKMDEAVADNWGDAAKTEEGEKFNRFAYNTIASTVDNVARNFVLGIYGRGQAANIAAEGLSLKFMGLQVAPVAMYQAKERGLDDTRSIITGLAAAGIEIITEKIGLDALFNKSATKSAMQYLLKNFMAEGSEEFLSDWMNTAVDVAYDYISGQDKAEWNSLVESYEKSMSHEDAVKKVVGEKLGESFESFLSGAVSGALLGGGGIFNYANSGQESYEIDPNYQSLKGGKYDSVMPDIQRALSMEGTKSADIAQDILDKINADKDVSNFELGAFAEQLQADNISDIANTDRQAVIDEAKIYDETRKDAEKLEKLDSRKVKTDRLNTKIEDKAAELYGKLIDVASNKNLASPNKAGVSTETENLTPANSSAVTGQNNIPVTMSASEVDVDSLTPQALYKVAEASGADIEGLSLISDDEMIRARVKKAIASRPGLNVVLAGTDFAGGNVSRRPSAVETMLGTVNSKQFRSLLETYAPDGDQSNYIKDMLRAYNAGGRNQALNISDYSGTDANIIQMAYNQGVADRLNGSYNEANNIKGDINDGEQREEGRDANHDGNGLGRDGLGSGESSTEVRGSAEVSQRATERKGYLDHGSEQAGRAESHSSERVRGLEEAAGRNQSRRTSREGEGGSPSTSRGRAENEVRAKDGKVIGAARFIPGAVRVIGKNADGSNAIQQVSAVARDHDNIAAEAYSILEQNGVTDFYIFNSRNTGKYAGKILLEYNGTRAAFCGMDYEGSKMFIVANSPYANALQLARHELCERLITNGVFSASDVLSGLKKTFSPSYINKLVDLWRVSTGQDARDFVCDGVALIDHIDAIKRSGAPFDEYDAILLHKVQQYINYLVNQKTNNAFGSSVTKYDGTPTQNIASPGYSSAGVQFSMSGPVEETDRLIAWHNIDSSAIDSAIELGGLAMPSWAVKRANTVHGSYGDISVIANKASIDPAISSSQMVFAGDAWTPVFPRIDYKVNADAAEAVTKKVRSLIESAGAKASDFNVSGYLDPGNLADKLRDERGNFSEAFRRNDGMRVAFLKDTGREINIPTKEKQFSRLADNNMLREIVRRFPDVMGMSSQEKMEAEPVLRDLLYDSYVARYGKEVADKIGKEELSFSDVDNIFYGAEQYSRSGGEKAVDKSELSRMLEDFFSIESNQREYEAWLKELGKDLVEKKGIRNNADMYTPSGNRRNFDSLHFDYNLANIVKAMKGQPKQGRSQFLSGAGSVKGAALKSFANIEDVRAEIDRLVSDESDESKAAYEKFSSDTQALAGRVADDLFDGAEILAEILGRAKSVSAIERYLNNEYGFLETERGLDLSALAKDIYALGKEANTLPMEYFEAKTYRAFPFSESAGIVVPDTLPKETQKKLSDLGANVLTYKDGDNEDRLRVVNGIAGARFSKSIEYNDFDRALSREQWAKFYEETDALISSESLATGLNFLFIKSTKNAPATAVMYLYDGENRSVVAAFRDNSALIDAVSSLATRVKNGQITNAKINNEILKLATKGVLRKFNIYSGTYVPIGTANRAQGVRDAGDSRYSVKRTSGRGSSEGIDGNVGIIPGQISLDDVEAYLKDNFDGYAKDKKSLELAADAAKSLDEIKVLGCAISQEYIKQGGIDLRGSVVNTPEDVAALCHVFRDPRFETFRILYVSGNKVVGSDATTSKLVNSAFAYFGDDVSSRNSLERSINSYKYVRDRMRSLGADGYYLLHNHPSGDVTASREDNNVTRSFAGNVFGFKGHIVLDHSVFGFIEEDGSSRIQKLKEYSSVKDNLLSPSIDHRLLSLTATRQDVVATIGRELAFGDNYSSIIYADAKGKVRALEEAHNSKFQDDGIFDYIKESKTNYGAMWAFVVTKNNDVFSLASGRIYNDVIKDSILLTDDAYVDARETSGVTEEPGYINGMRYADIPVYKVGEEKLTYSKDLDNNGNKLTVQQAKYFANSKVRDENGNLKVMYHGTRKGGFTVFDNTKSDDLLSFFFTDFIENAREYSGTYDEYNPFTGSEGLTLDRVNEFLNDEGLNAELKNKKYILRDDYSDEVKTFDSLAEVERYYVEEFIPANAPDKIRGNYKVYLNIENPMEINAYGNDWSHIPVFDMGAEVHSTGANFDEDATGTIFEYYGEICVRDENGDEHMYESFDELLYDWYLDFYYADTRELAYEASQGDYDGVLINNVWDNGEFMERQGVESNIAICFNSNQVKSVDNLNPTNDKDIRYSASVESDYEVIKQGNALLQSEAEELAKYNAKSEYWAKRTKPVAFNVRSGVSTESAKKIVEAFPGNMAVPTLAHELKSLTEKMIKGEVNYSHARQEAIKISNEIIADASEHSSDFWDAYKDIRAGLSQVTLTLSEQDARDIADFGDFKNKKFGTIRVGIGKGLAKGTIAVDSKYAELNQEYPWLFPDDITAPSDQLIRIVETMDLLYNAYDNPYDYDRAEASEEIANAVLNECINNGYTSMGDVYDGIKRKSDSYKKQFEEPVARAKQKIAEIRQQRDQKIADLKEHFAQVKANAKARQDDRDARVRLLKLVKRLNNKKLPAVTKEYLNMYIGDIDTVAVNLTGKKKASLENLQAWYEGVTNPNSTLYDPNFIPDSRIEDEFKRLEKKPIGEMSASEVASLTEVLLALDQQYRDRNKLIQSSIKHEVQIAGRIVYDDIMAQGNYDDRSGLGKTMDKYLLTETLSPVREAHRVVGYNDSDPLYIAVQELQDGQRESQRYEMLAERFVSSWTNDKKFIGRISGKNAEEITIHGSDADGNPVAIKITPAMRMSLYLHSLNPDNVRHIAYGGIIVPSIEKVKKGDNLGEAYKAASAVRLTPVQIGEAISGMTKDEMEFCEAVQKYFDFSTMEINKVSEVLKGYSLANVEHYFPIDVDRTFLDANFETVKMDGTIEGMGFTKERVKSKKPICLYDVTTVLERSIRQHSKYVGMAIPVRNFNKLYNVSIYGFVDEIESTPDGQVQTTVLTHKSSIQKALIQKFGVQADDYFARLMADVQNPASRRDKNGSVFEVIRSHYAQNVLSLNLAVAMKQAASYPTAAAVLGWKPLGKALGSFAKNMSNKQMQDYMKQWEEYTPDFWYRQRGYSSVELGDLQKKGITLPTWLNWIQKIDLATTATLMKASEYYIQESNPGLKEGSTEYMQAVAALYNQVIEETQPNYAVMQRPQILRSDRDLVKFLNMFKTQPFQNFNILADAFGNYRAKRMAMNNSTNADEETKKKVKADYDKAKTGFGRAIASQAVAAFVFALMQYAWDKFREKDKKYEDDGVTTAWSWFKGISRLMMESGAGMIPYGSTLIEAVEGLTDKVIKSAGGEAFFDATYYGLDVSATSAINDLWNSIQSFAGDTVGLVAGKTKGKEYILSVIDTACKIAGFFGIPAENVKKLAQAFIVRVDRINVLALTSDDPNWDKLTKEQQNKILDYSSGIANGGTDKKLEDSGLDKDRYLLFKIALELADKPNGSGNYGTYAKDEVVEALANTRLTPAEKEAIYKAFGYK